MLCQRDWHVLIMIFGLADPACAMQGLLLRSVFGWTQQRKALRHGAVGVLVGF